MAGSTSFPKVRGGSGNMEGYGMTPKNRAKFLKKLSVPPLETLQKQSSASVAASK